MAATDPSKSRSFRDSRFPLFFTIGWALVLIVLQVNWHFAEIDDKWVDKLMYTRGMAEADPRVIIVAMDDESIRRVGQYPWPRSVYGKLLDRLYSLGAKVVALDIIFPDPSTPKEDQALINATRKAGDRLVHSISVNPNVKDHIAFVYPFEGLNKVVKGAGLVYQATLSMDGAVRRTPTVVGLRPQAELASWTTDPEGVPSLGLAALAMYEGKSFRDYIGESPYIRLNYRGQTEVFQSRVKINNKTQDIYNTAYAIPRFSAYQIMEKNLPEYERLKPAERASFKGAIVLVGSTAVAAYDHYPNPFTSMMPGVEVHATLIDNLLQDRHLRSPSPIVPVLVIILFAGLAYRLIRFGPIQGFLLFFVVIGAFAGATYYAFLQNWLLDFVGPATALSGTFFVLVAYKVRLEQLEKRAVREMFGQYVSPEVVDELVKDRDKLKLGGQKRDMTMFFLDIAHFTSISEKMPAENLIKFLNHYLAAFTDDVLRHRGVVDKYIGDCIMAFWNAPITVKDHRKKACFAAIDCANTIQRLNKEYHDPLMPEKPAVRIGLNSGEVIVGNTGSERKLAYTVLGDEVNLASRLEGANKFFGSVAMCSEDTYKGAEGEVEARTLGRVRVVGKEIPIRVYELLAHKGKLSKEWAEALPRWAKGVEHYEKREFEKAKPEFEAVLKLIPGDKPTKLYLSACDDYITIPPPEAWDAVFNLISK
ncbi:MAG: CHASE2 domain-containing protein [Elusimicrobiota bacterium]